MPRTTKARKDPNLATSQVDLAEVERLLEFMQKHNLEEFEYEREGLRVMLKKASARLQTAPRHLMPVSEEHPAPTVQTPVQVAPSIPPSQEPAEKKAPAEDVHEVKSPIVGTFYSSPSPEAGPFVKIGDLVEVGQVLCIIEAMKLMNEIECDVAGEITHIFVENGHPVEYGERLFGIRTGRRK